MMGAEQPGAPMGGWVPHVLMIALMGLMVAGARRGHLSDAEALALAFDPEAAPRKRIWAMHVAANRSSERDSRLGVGLVNEMLGDDDECIREAALMVDLARHAIQPTGAQEGAAPPLQEAYVFQPLVPGTAAHRLRSFVLYRRKAGMFSVGGLFRMGLEEAEWVLNSSRDLPLPSDAEAARMLQKNARISPL